MIARTTVDDTGFRYGIAASTVIHVAVFLFIFWWSAHTPRITPRETYYVDVVNLPVPHPQQGSPTQQGQDRPAESLPQEKPQTLPAAPTSKPNTAAKRTDQQDSVDSQAFAKRMQQLGQKADARREDEVLARLREKVKSAGSGQAGMPTTSGTQSGSEYGAYLKSRLEDALERTSSYSSKNPEVVIRLTIDADGKLLRRRTERSSGDRTFEISVLRAIELASDKLPPPPSRTIYEGLFVFKPKGIAIR